MAGTWQLLMGTELSTSYVSAPWLRGIRTADLLRSDDMGPDSLRSGGGGIRTHSAPRCRSLATSVMGVVCHICYHAPGQGSVMLQPSSWNTVEFLFSFRTFPIGMNTAFSRSVSAFWSGALRVHTPPVG